jgi:hypothetical protein
MNENYKKLKLAFRTGEINIKEFEEYTKLMKDALKASLTDLCNLCSILNDYDYKACLK